MALLKTVELPTGVVVAYWKIAMDSVILQSCMRYSAQDPPQDSAVDTAGYVIPADAIDPKITFVIYGYIDMAARLAGKEPVLAEVAYVSCPKEGNLVGERRPLMYSELKKQPGWSAAIDA